jgi:hypothetical protein
MTNTLRTDPELDEHLRRTLRAVASTIKEAPLTATQKPRSRRRVFVGLGAVVVAVPLAAAAIIGIGPEYVNKIPPDGVIVAGSIDGNRYWMVEAFHTDDCGSVEPGVEIVIEDSNIFGREWNTIGHSYGEPKNLPGGGWCGYDVSDALARPALSYASGVFVGDAFLWSGGVHPDITAVRATIDGSTHEVEVHPQDGAGYYVLVVPADTTEYTVELLIDGEAVPGSKETKTVPDPN